MSMDWLPIDLLWRGALVVVPLALLVTVICRLFPCRPSTRHAMWLVVLVILVASPFLPRFDFGMLPVGPPAEMVHAPRTELAPRREQEVFAPTASSGPPVAAVERKSRGIATGRRPTSRWPMNNLPDLSGGEAIVKRETLAEPSGTEAPVVGRPQKFAGADKPPSPLSEWVSRANAVWIALLRLPSIPLPVWMGGIALLVLVGLGRIGRSIRLVRSGQTAPRSVVRMVHDASADLGLRHPPTVVMIDRRVTPMLFCAWQVTLVLPTRLWAQLDDVGRRAVIFHELAHLRRRDHWVCWADMIVGLVYWWHPVVWWIRRRIREEADLCCDTWVTTLMPDGRRAYAQALLDARKFGSLIPVAVPSVGLGASTRRTKRFARRLTMVMTAQTSPRISRKGTLLACTLALGGALVTPLWACPDAQDAKPTRVKAPTAPKAPKAPRAPKAPKAPQPPRAPELSWYGGSETTFEQFMQERDGLSREQQMQQLERELERLHRQIEEIHRYSGQRERSRERSRERREHSRERGRAAVAVPDVFARALAGHSVAVTAGNGGCGSCIAGAARGNGPVVVRDYELSKGKLARLTELMILSDVPIRVRPLDGGIEVHATEGQQCLFEAFVMMIGKDETKEAYKLSGAKLEALTKLMVRSDVPIFVEPQRDGIKVHGSELEQAIFGAFISMIHPDGGVAGATNAHAYAEALADMASQYESQANAQLNEMRGLRAAMIALANQGNSIERKADRMRLKADRLRDQADELRDKADDVRDRADELDGKKRESTLVKAKALILKAKAIEREAESIDDQAAVIEQQAEAILEQAEAIEEQIEVFQELADRRDDN